MSLVLIDPTAGAPPSPEPPKKKAKKPKTERVVLPWEFEEFRDFVQEANIPHEVRDTPKEGTREARRGGGFAHRSNREEERG